MTRMGCIFITGIFGNIYTKQWEFLTSKTGIRGGPDPNHNVVVDLKGNKEILKSFSYIHAVRPFINSDR